MNNGDKPAYPLADDSRINFMNGNEIFPGLTKRERFAMAAMEGYLSAEGSTYDGLEDELAAKSKRQADALLAALEQD